ncbi:MAG TPA: M23 family metallopeptidase [Chitinophagaceae bacterium]|nr:M23 family metallopeptidase [Chitinophagaceae bacterium]
MTISRKFLKLGKWLLILTGIIILILFVLFTYQTKVTKNVDTYIYELPFAKGTSHRIVQGYGGLFSHSHIAALDFEMPVGTSVYAAREGKVYSYKDNSSEGGYVSSYNGKANYLIIQHNDGSFGCYWHLKENGVLVKKGYVSKGQKIGLSGATGLVIKPHLHFSVKRKLTYDMDSFVQTKFKTKDGILLLDDWETYERPFD